MATQGDEVVQQAQRRLARQRHAKFLQRLAAGAVDGILARIQAAARQGIVAGPPAHGQRTTGENIGQPVSAQRQHDRDSRPTIARRVQAYSGKVCEIGLKLAERQASAGHSEGKRMAQQSGLQVSMGVPSVAV